MSSQPNKRPPPGLLTINEIGRGYSDRTRHNAENSAITVACAVDFGTAGERLTTSAAGAKHFGVPVSPGSLNQAHAVTFARRLFARLRGTARPVINVAGNGIYTLNHFGITQPDVDAFVFWLLQPVHAHLPLRGVVCGGQTGFDIAGAAAACALGIPCTINAPLGCVQRGADGIDKPVAQAAIRAHELVPVRPALRGVRLSSLPLRAPSPCARHSARALHKQLRSTAGRQATR